MNRELLNDPQRLNVPASLFGCIGFALKVEPTVYTFAGQLAPAYQGGYWQMYQLCNQGFYMAPDAEQTYSVTSMNGAQEEMSADALGITACLFTYSHLSFGNDTLAAHCAEQFHRLREWAMEHSEARAILAVID